MSRAIHRACVAPLWRLGGWLSGLCLLGACLAGTAGVVWAAELQIEAPRFTFDQASNVYTYEDGRLTLGELSLFASRMELNAATGAVRASGFIRVETPDVTGIAEALELDATTRVGTFHKADLYVLRGGIFLRAEEVVIQPDGHLLVRNCSFTTCTPGVPGAWRIAASSLELRPEGLGVAWNPRLYLGPAPVLWLPGMAWPIVRERRTGLLPPRLSRDSSSLRRFDLGWRLQLPLFLNLGYDHDLTVVPEPIQNRGTALTLEYNYAFWEQQRGRLTLWGIRERDARDPAQENDLLTPLGLTPPDAPLTRHRADWLHNQALGDATRLILAWHDSSDGQVRREYDRIGEYRPYRTYQASLTRQWEWADAALTFEQNADFLQESAYGDGVGFTDLEQRPQLLPRFLTHLGGRVFEAVPLTLGLGLSATRFRARQDVSGRLAEASPSLSLPIALGGAFELRPSVTRHLVSYSGLTRYNAGGPDTELPGERFGQTEGTLELRTALARVYLPEGGRYAALKHRIVPRLIFEGVQDVPQPLSDTVLRARVAERLVTLRLDNALLGRARGEPAPRDRVDAATGSAAEVPGAGSTAAGGPAAGSTAAGSPAAGSTASELLRVNLIQRYNLLLEPDAPALAGPLPSRRQETLPGEPLLPLLLEIGAGGSQFSASALLNYHHQLRRNTRTELSLQGRTAPGTELGVGYTFNEFTYVTPDDKVVPAGNAFTFNGAMAVADAWGLGFSGRINLSDATPPLERRIDRGELFVEYRPVCYALRLSYTEQVVSTLESGSERFYLDRHLALSFDLIGLVGGPTRAAAPAPTAATGAAAGFHPDRAAAAATFNGTADASRPAHCRS